MGLHGKVAVVTGGSRGIGRAIALRLARDGATVVINYRGDEASARSAVAEAEAAGGSAFATRGDVASVEAIEAFFGEVDAELARRNGGDPKFDILVNNAGIARPGAIDQASEGDFDALFATNVKGPFFVTQKALARMRDGGRIINVSSNLSTRPIPRALAYCMTKGALDNFTVGLAAAVGARGITVNTLAPGLTRTDLNAAHRSPEFEAMFESITALGRIGEVEDIAGAAAFLASDDAAWVTGQYLCASGGVFNAGPGITS